MSHDEYQIIRSLKEAVEELQRTVEEVRTAIIGNEELGQEGIVPTLRDHEKRLRRIERIFLLAAGAVLVFRGFYAVLSDFFHR